jgi:hypothetical protein
MSYYNPLAATSTTDEADEANSSKIGNEGEASRHQVRIADMVVNGSANAGDDLESSEDKPLLLNTSARGSSSVQDFESMRQTNIRNKPAGSASKLPPRSLSSPSHISSVLSNHFNTCLFLYSKGYVYDAQNEVIFKIDKSQSFVSNTEAASAVDDYNRLDDNEMDRKEANKMFSIDNKYEMVTL